MVPVLHSYFFKNKIISNFILLDETLNRSKFKYLNIGDLINLNTT